MRIGQVARLTGVSPRSIRHYHRLGLVEEPPRTPGGIRSYSISHVVRVLRVRYLAESGVPLRSVARVLDGGEQHDVLGEIELLRDHLDTRVAALQRQREKLDALEARLSSGLPPGSVPAEVDRALDACTRDADGEPGLQRLLERERDMLDLLAMTVDFPAGLSAAFTRIAADPSARSAYLRVLRGFSTIEGRPPGEVTSEIDALVTDLLADGVLADLVVGAPPEGEGFTTEQVVDDPAQREVVRRVLDRLGFEPDGRRR